jgi:hypothetical protein
MKPILTAFIMSCALMTAHAGDHYIYGQDGRAFYFSGRYLYDSQTGGEVGYLEGGYLYDSKTGQTIGYKSGRAIYSSRDGSVLGYCEGD